MKLELTTNPLNDISGDTLAIFAYQDKKTYIPSSSFSELPKEIQQYIKKILELEKFKGKEGEMLSIPLTIGSIDKRFLVVGLGKKEEIDNTTIRNIGGLIAKKQRKVSKSIVVTLPTDAGNAEDKLKAFVEGMLLGEYTFGKYQKQEEKDETLELCIFAALKGAGEIKRLQEQITEAELFARATIVARDLINEPSDVVTPTYLAKFAQDIAKGSPDITCTIYDKEQAEKMGMGAFLGIARAADTPPKFIFLSYTPKKAASKNKLAIVGKGITFDSGGINVKPGDHMSDMKMDMSGAATVLGVFSVISEIKPDFPVIGLIAATPNLISGRSIVPGDIVRAMNGKTIEVLNTDAEGRVTMADSLSFAVKEKATEIIDLATLTGAAMVALGTDYAALFANNEKLKQGIQTAARKEGELMWELPLSKEYKDLNKSDVADIANIPSSRYGGTISAALFLQEFVNKTPWIHLDIAGPAFMHKATDIGPKGATGFGVRTLLQYIKEVK